MVGTDKKQKSIIYILIIIICTFIVPNLWLYLFTMWITESQLLLSDEIECVLYIFNSSFTTVIILWKCWYEGQIELLPEMKYVSGESQRGGCKGISSRQADSQKSNGWWRISEEQLTLCVGNKMIKSIHFLYDSQYSTLH